MLRGLEHLPRFAGGLFILILLYALSGAAYAQSVDPAQITIPDGFLGNGGEGGLSGSVVLLLVLVTVLSLAPGIAMMATCLPFMIIVFSFLRQAIGVQASLHTWRVQLTRDRPGRPRQRLSVNS